MWNRPGIIGFIGFIILALVGAFLITPAIPGFGLMIGFGMVFAFICIIIDASN